MKCLLKVSKCIHKHFLDRPTIMKVTSSHKVLKLCLKLWNTLWKCWILLSPCPIECFPLASAFKTFRSGLQLPPIKQSATRLDTFLKGVVTLFLLFLICIRSVGKVWLLVVWTNKNKRLFMDFGFLLGLSLQACKP